MKFFRPYFKFLLRNKLYTFISIFGFSISLMFVITLGFYVKQEFTKDSFHENSKRIYLAAYNENRVSSFLPFADYVQDNCPEVETYCRAIADFPILQSKDESEQVKAIFADANFFSMFSFKLIEGDPVTALEKNSSVVVTKTFATRLFKKESSIGKSLTLNNKTYTITGVVNDFSRYNTVFPDVDIIMDFNSKLRPGDLQNWNSSSTVLFFLEKVGADINSKTETLADFMMAKSENWHKNFHFLSLKDVYFNVNSNALLLKSNNKTTVMVYFSIAILILIISILNYVNMTVAQSGSRGKEVAIKRLIGSERKSIIIQFLSESLVITVVTFILGLLMALVSQSYFNNILGAKQDAMISSIIGESSANLSILNQFTPTVIIFIIIAIIIISLIIGIIPAMLISGFKPIEIVKGTFSRKIKGGFSKTLIIFQYTIAIALLICSFCIKKQSSYMLNSNMGFNKDRVFVMSNTLNTNQTEGFREKLLSIPGVENVSYSQGTPIDGGNNNNPEINGEKVSFQVLTIDTSFTNVYQIDVKPTGIIPSGRTIWVNEYTYKFLQPDPITQEVDFGPNQGKFQVTGITSNFNIKSLHTPLNLMYMFMLENKKAWNISVKISSGANLLATTELIKKTYSEYNGGKLYQSEFVDVSIQKWYVNEQRMSSIMSVFTLLTLVIMLMGVFAMSLYMVRQKEREIGVRKVNGATVKEILEMLNKESLIRVLIGFVIATPIAYYAISKWMEGFAYKTNISWWIFALAVIIVALLTLISVSWMTYRAATANPVESLKSE